MSNPVVVEALRGPLVESRHRGAGAVVDAEGQVVFSFGDIDLPVFPRSAVKAFQALPLIESGAADKAGFTDAEIALAVASHGGEARHAETAAGMLAKAGRDVGALECGAHWPLGDKAARALAASGGSPSALHNNCSGKHSGFVCLACGEGWDPRGYVGRAHPVQVAVRDALADMTGAPLGEDVCGTDGCSIPSYAIATRRMAHGFARFGSGHGLGPSRRKAAERIRAAVAANPFMVAGTDRFDTQVMTLLGARAFTKTGAEGVFCAALPEQGLGIAVKAEDGAARASQVMVAALIAQFLPMDDAQRSAFARFTAPVLKNWDGIEVGQIRAAGPLA
jgi:L-asparaginase II